ncbi:Tim44 domain-containing protein [Halomonas koreensis]|uniref:Tim44-like domain-containing protein n=1 Tax=Halomonas koreensis TaxID=245385 RepID=A0ABU1G6F8_9GAMM|nr:Tim44-like domain-containing protein [Halomonas koreensis]MDR5868522.1 Tim44-like domain-containing protein [Halomonas koreensis]
MRHLLVMLMVGVLGLGLAVDHADARRMGGGKSVGSYSRSADAPSATAPRAGSTAAGQRKPSSGLSRFAGPFAGMLAGGLLASLFFGGAFDELRLFDILLIGGALFLLFRLFARRRPAMAGGPAPDAQAAPQAFQAATGAGGLGKEPTWFDRERFLGGAKEHFMTLQRAWDNNDFSRIQEYVTPELYNLLREERDRQPANNRTEIVRLFAELGSVQEIDDRAEATVIFHGVLDENGEQNAFNETWHLVRSLREEAPWYVQGIEQNPGA